MNRFALPALLSLLLLSPVAGAFTLFSEKQMAGIGADNFTDIKKKTPVSKNAALNARAACVAGPLTDLVGGRSRWEVVVFDTDEVNAFALPGRKIGIYRGLFKVATTPAELAAVLGHEIGHVKAKHSNERVSTQLLTQFGLQALDSFTSGRKNSQFIMAGLGIGAQYGVLLPFGRKQETEADEIGLKLMASAGFNPQAAPQLWRNMQKNSGRGLPTFLSTHPSHSQRIRDLENRVPSVMSRYENAPRPRC